MTTPILGITEISGNQQNQYITANEMVRALEAATNDVLTVNIAAGDATLTAAQFTGAYAFNATGHSVIRNINIPASKRAFAVLNTGSAAVTVTRGTTQVSIAANEASALFSDGTADGLFQLGGGGGGGGSSTWGSITGDIDAQTDLNTILTNFGVSLTSTGVLAPNDSVLLQALNDTTLRILPLTSGLFYNDISTLGMNNAVKGIGQNDIALSTIPIASNGLYIFYVSYDSAGAVYFTQSDPGTSNDRLRLGIVLVKRVAGVNSFWDGAAGPRNVLTYPEMAGNSAYEKAYLTLASDVAILPNANLTVKNTAGILKGESIGWGTSTPNQRAVAAAAVTSFITLNPSISTQTALPAAGTAVQTTQYWNGSAMVSTGGANSASVQRFLMTATGGIFLQVGEATYASLQSAVENAVIAPFSPLFPDFSHFTEIARIATRNGAANLSDTNDAVFVNKSGGGSGSSGAFGTMAFQNANAVSITGGAVDGTIIGATTRAAGNFNNVDVDGNLNIRGLARRITADFSNSTLSNRAFIETSVANSATSFGIKPSGSGASSHFSALNSSDPNNTSRIRVSADPTGVSIVSDSAGSGTNLPLSLYAGGLLGQVLGVNGNTGFGVASPDTSCRIQSANGIKLGNTANSNPAVFDNYLEGVFTPFAIGATTAGSATYSVQKGDFTLKGNRCAGQLSIAWSGHTGTGLFRIAGLPYPPNTAANSNAPVADYMEGAAPGAGKTWRCYIDNSGAFIQMVFIDQTSGVVTRPNISSYASVGYLMMQFDYMIQS